MRPPIRLSHTAVLPEHAASDTLKHPLLNAVMLQWFYSSGGPSQLPQLSGALLQAIGFALIAHLNQRLFEM